MKLHVITGLPRAGSTLMQNVLAQNPKFKVTSTSELPSIISEISKVWSNSLEIKNYLNKDRVGTEQRLSNTMKAFIETWHGTDKVVFDKSRGWTNTHLLLNDLYPDAVLIVMVRDLRNVFASVEKQHQKNPILDTASNFEEKTVYNRADQMFSPQGLIGGPLAGITDVIQRKNRQAIFIKYEDFADDPEKTMKTIYEKIDERYYLHNFENIQNTADDPDGFYLWKYPHQGCGKISELQKDEWKQLYTEDLANIIMEKFKDFNEHFNY